MRSGVKGVLFDAGMTLIRPHPSVEEIYAAGATGVGIPVSADRFRQPFRDSFRAYQQALGRGEDLPTSTSAAGDEAMWRRITDRVLAALGDDGVALRRRGWFTSVYRTFHDGSAWAPYPETVEVLAHLQGRGLRLAVVSNFGPYLERILGQLGLRQFFTGVAVSAQVGARKPAAPIFQAALGTLQLHPGQVLHVGDSYPEDIEGARALGIPGLHLDRQAAGSGGSIGSLWDVLDHL